MTIRADCVCVHMDGRLHQSPDCHAHPDPASKPSGRSTPEQEARSGRYATAIWDAVISDSPLPYSAAQEAARAAMAVADAEYAERLGRANEAIDRARMMQAHAEDAETAACESLNALVVDIRRAVDKHHQERTSA